MFSIAMRFTTNVLRKRLKRVAARRTNRLD